MGGRTKHETELIRTSFTLEPAQSDWLSAAADKRNITRSAMLRAIIDVLRARKRKRRHVDRDD